MCYVAFDFAYLADAQAIDDNLVLFGLFSLMLGHIYLLVYILFLFSQ